MPRSLVSVIVVSCAAVVAAQTPPRDRAAVDKGTAVISGSVVDAETGTPIRRANVYAYAGSFTQTARSDAEGRFVLTELPAGKLTLNATKVGYLAAIGVMSANPRQRITPIAIAAGQTIEKVVIALHRGGVIAGNLLDDNGDPLDGAEVRPLRYGYADGQRRLVYGGQPVRTDDLGGFRLYGLQPGEYYVSASADRSTMFSGPSGVVNPEGPAPTYYPGTANPLEAKPITVRIGAETRGVIFPIVTMRLARISGRLQSATTDNFSGWSMETLASDPFASGAYGFGGNVRPDGTFELANVPPGTYGIEIRPFRTLPESPSELARLVVTVGGEDIHDLVVMASPAGTARGRVVMDDGTRPPLAMGALRLSFLPVDQKSPFRSGPPVVVKSDWTFETRGLFGPMRLQADSVTAAGSSPPAWTFRSVMLGNRDVTDSGIDFRGGEATDGITVVLTRRVTRITGRLDPAANPMVSRVLVFTADERKWSVPRRYVRTARPDAGGEYSLNVVPNEEYLIAAVEDIDLGDWWSDHDVLRAIGAHAARLTINEGETRTHDLRILDWRR